MLTLTTFIQHSIRSPRHSTQKRKRKKKKGIQIGKEEVIKLPLFADMVLYIENPKDATPKLLELINEFNKFSGYKINIRNPLHFYILTMNYQKEELREHSHWNMHQKE